MQVYASINPVVHLVNVGSESGGVRSLANVTVIFSLPVIILSGFIIQIYILKVLHLIWETPSSCNSCYRFYIFYQFRVVLWFRFVCSCVCKLYWNCWDSCYLRFEGLPCWQTHQLPKGCRIYTRNWIFLQIQERKDLGCGHCNFLKMAVSLWLAAMTGPFMSMI